MKSIKSTLVLGLMLALVGGVAVADHHGEKKTRVGTCEDAKKQQDYFCDMKNAASDSRLINRARWNRSAKDGLRRVKRGNTSGLPWLMMVNLPVSLDG